VQGYGAAELAGVVFGLLYVWLAIRENVWCWPAGLANAALFLIVFFHARLYGAAALQGVYFALSLYGWRQWLRGGEQHGRLRVSRTPLGWAIGLGAFTGVTTVLLALYFENRTADALPWSDAATTAASLAAQWMTTRKWLESWLAWIAVDAVYVAMYLSQRMHPTAVLYAVFLVMAVFGYREWRASMRVAAA
jgi:nicotinamide mononucleotide transporter